MKKIRNKFCFITKLPKKIFSLLRNLLRNTTLLARNPKLIWHSLKKTVQKTKLFFKRLPKNTKEYFFWLLMSAENNAERLRRKRIKDIPTPAEIKEYQAYLRKKTAKYFLTTAATIMLVIALPGLFQKYFAHSKTYQWIQSSWAGGTSFMYANSTNLASWMTNWTYYNSVSSTNLVTANAGGVALTQISNVTTVQQNGTSANLYSGQSGSTFNSNVLGSGAYTTADGISNSGPVKLKKPAGASCGTSGDHLGNAECASGTCGSGVCCADACCGVSSVTDTRDTNNSTYGTIALAGYCWLNRNLNVGTMLATGNTNPSDPFDYNNVEKWCPMTSGTASSAADVATNCNGNNGALYTWAEANGLASTCLTSDCTPLAGGICPSGWHIATTTEWGALKSAYSTGTLLGNAGFNFGYAGLLDLASSLTFNYLNSAAEFWAYNGSGSNGVMTQFTSNNSSSSTYPKKDGMSVRCVKN